MEELIPKQQRVVVVGAGLSGMVLALDLARRGQRVTLLEKTDGTLRGSRAITYSPATMEVLCALGCGEAILREAVRWSTGTEFLSKKKLRLVNHGSHSRERFTGYHSLPQPLVHENLMAKVKACTLVDLRLDCELHGLEREGSRVRVHARHNDAPLEPLCDYLIAADGAHSAVRRMLDLRLTGDRVPETFLICDIDTPQPLASDRTVWFDPPFADGKIALLLRYGERKYRFDVHMPGWERRELDEPVVRSVIREAFGTTFEYRLDFWTTYQFACEMMDEFTCGPIYFLGDAAHLVPPFGARGGNGGAADAFNLSWKLAGVSQGRYSKELLPTYGSEMRQAARQNINEAAKTMRFLVPQTALDRSIHNAALQLCGRDALALQIVNSGRMSRPCYYGQETQTYLAEEERSRCILPILKKIPNFPMRCGDQPTHLHDCLGDEFSIVVFAAAENVGVQQQQCLGSELGSLPTIVSILVVVGVKAIKNSCPGVLWDEYGLLRKYLCDQCDLMLLIRPDRYLLTAVSFTRAERLKTVLRAIGGAELGNGSAE
jgi:3-(3-hydroxy-phenyl)propionate hydroxylase